MRKFGISYSNPRPPTETTPPPTSNHPTPPLRLLPEPKSREPIPTFPRPHLGRLGEPGGAVIAAHAQHVLGAVIKLGESVKFAVAEAHGRLENAVQGAAGAVGSVEERPEKLPAQSEVAGAAEVEGEAALPELVPGIQGKAGIQEWGIRAQAALPAQQPEGIREERLGMFRIGWKSWGI